jgi:uncharacterized protein (DUF169 family)
MGAQLNLIYSAHMSLTAQQTSALSSLALTSSPVAIAFVSTAPEGLSRIDSSRPASCSYWTEASNGRSFYTTADDHGGCPVGAFTHGVSLNESQATELQSIVGMMVELKYLKKEEIPLIPHRTDALRFAVYSPLAGATFEPDAVVFRGNARQIMLLSEAARAAGIFETAAVMGRPACAMLPQSVGTQAGVASIGCIGNRVYTGLDDNELYITVPGGAVGRVLEQLETVQTANAALEEFHQNRRKQSIY